MSSKNHFYGVEGFNVYCDGAEGVAECVKFYSETLGLPFLIPYEQGGEYAAFDLVHVSLWLRPRPAGFREEKGRDGHAALATTDIEMTCQELEGKVDWADESICRWDFPDGTHYRFRGFYDPAGNLMWIIEPHDKHSPMGPGGNTWRSDRVGMRPGPETPVPDAQAN